MRYINKITKKLNSIYYPSSCYQALPKVLMVEPTNICNIKCAMCYVQNNLQKRDTLSLEDFKKVINQFPKIRELILCGIGEPLLNNDLFLFISEARNKGIGFINLFTNGKLLNGENAVKIVESKINRIQVSVHSFNPVIFSQIRNEDPSNLEKIKNNIRRLVHFKKKASSPLMVCCNAVLNKFNYSDMIDFVKQAEELGVNRVEFFQMTTAGDSLKAINAPKDKMGDMIRKVRKFAHNSKVELGFLSGNDYGRCFQLWDFIMIHADGTISPCNGIFPTENIEIGNILYTPIEKMWNSSKYQELRQRLRSRDLEYCKYCESGYCIEGKNPRWFKNYYLRPLKRIIKSLYVRS